jgi:hypothetical protein
MGIEPMSEAWEASVLPLNYARSFLLILSAFAAYEQPPCSQRERFGLWFPWRIEERETVVDAG